MEITLDSPLDMHIHFRDGDMLKLVAPLTAKYFCGAVVMPNLVPPVDSVERVVAYRERILEAVKGEKFDPFMIAFFRNFTPKELKELKKHVLAVKLYPDGITTNSEGGVTSLRDAEKILAMMEDLEIPLMVHGETNGYVMDRESEFLEIYEGWAKKFPKLKITMEHITTAEAVDLLDRYENLRATVTLHHLVLTLDDVIGGALNPHHFCKPVVKRAEDREALLEAALEAHPRLMFGSDSAPHPREKKECMDGAAGVFSAPILLPALAQLFEQHHALKYLEKFVSKNAQKLYRVKVKAPVRKKVTLVKKAQKVPAQYGNVVPMFAGKALKWSVGSVD